MPKKLIYQQHGEQRSIELADLIPIDPVETKALVAALVGARVENHRVDDDQRREAAIDRALELAGISDIEIVEQQKTRH